MKDLNFNDRISYLAWRKEWKTTYKQVSKDIRESKNAWKSEQRKVTVKMDSYGYNIPTIEGKALYSSPTYYKTLRQLVMFKSNASELLKLLADAKEKSRVQREANLIERGLSII